MKKFLAVLLPIMLCATAVFAFGDDGNVVRWNTIVGVITAPGLDAPVAGIHAGATPWSVRSGFALVNLASGATLFTVNGLVINGSNSSGTPGPITSVTGTLICNPGTTQTVLDTIPVNLDPQGNARFVGHLEGVPAACANPLFLIRIAIPAGAAGKWIATGAQRVTSGEGR